MKHPYNIESQLGQLKGEVLLHVPLLLYAHIMTRTLVSVLLKEVSPLSSVHVNILLYSSILIYVHWESVTDKQLDWTPITDCDVSTICCTVQQVLFCVVACLNQLVSTAYTWTRPHMHQPTTILYNMCRTIHNSLYKLSNLCYHNSWGWDAQLRRT